MNSQGINRIFGIFFFLFGAFVWFAIPYQIKEPGITKIGPRFFPRTISIMLMFASTALVLETFLKSKKNINNNRIKKEKFELDIKEEVRVILLFFSMIAYVFLFPILGFILSSILIMGADLFLLKARKCYSYLILIVLVFLIYYIFKNLLYVQLP
ncbi:hypothetical protein ES705_08006 [subsurface metagenome]|nr:hypothetical protein [Clostridia bacterium]